MYGHNILLNLEKLFIIFNHTCNILFDWYLGIIIIESLNKIALITYMIKYYNFFFLNKALNF